MLKEVSNEIKVGRNIVIKGYQTNNTIAEKVFDSTFHCNKCKNIWDCKNARDCTFVKYISDRISSSVFNYNTKNPELTIVLNNLDECVKALQTIKRAKKLRSTGYYK